MAHRVITDGKWPKVGGNGAKSGNSGATGVNGLHTAGAGAGNNRSGDANSHSFRGANKLAPSQPPHDLADLNSCKASQRQTDKTLNGQSQQGVGGRYGGIGLYWWQLARILRLWYIAYAQAGGYVRTYVRLVYG